MGLRRIFRRGIVGIDSVLRCSPMRGQPRHGSYLDSSSVSGRYRLKARYCEYYHPHEYSLKGPIWVPRCTRN